MYLINKSYPVNGSKTHNYTNIAGSLVERSENRTFCKYGVLDWSKDAFVTIFSIDRFWFDTQHTLGKKYCYFILSFNLRKKT